jgi:hypothetical protein
VDGEEDDVDTRWDPSKRDGREGAELCDEKERGGEDEAFVMVGLTGGESAGTLSRNEFQESVCVREKRVSPAKPRRVFEKIEKVK